MPAESAADRLSFFNTDDFGIVGTYVLNGGGESSIDGIYDHGYIEVDLGTQVGVASESPMFECREADLPTGHARGDSLTLEGTAYTVEDIKPDGTGLVKLILEKV